VDKPTESDVFATAKRVLPGGTFGNFPGEVIIREGKGGRVWDEAGKEYVDFLLGSGPMLVGHAHPEVTEAAHAQIARGTTFFANNRLGIELAEAIVDAVPCAEQVRFVSSGSEADLYAMRAARAFTRKDKILKFEGGYHGMSDYSLMSLAPKRPGNFPQAVPDSPGIPRSVADEMLIAPFNDADAAGGDRQDRQEADEGERGEGHLPRDLRLGQAAGVQAGQQDQPERDVTGHRRHGDAHPALGKQSRCPRAEIEQHAGHSLRRLPPPKPRRSRSRPRSWCRSR